MNAEKIVVVDWVLRNGRSGEVNYKIAVHLIKTQQNTHHHRRVAVIKNNLWK